MNIQVSITAANMRFSNLKKRPKAQASKAVAKITEIAKPSMRKISPLLSWLWAIRLNNKQGLKM